MEEYLLRSHVHCCRRGDAYVFLDLKQDNYMLVAGPAADALRALADANPGSTTAQSADPLRELEQGGLLTKDRTGGRPFATTAVDLAVEPLLDLDTAPPAIRMVDWWNFAVACTTATVRLRWHPLEKTVAAVAKRKALHGAHDHLELERARHLTAVFNRLRSLFPANYLCLFDSLALIEFLARYQLYPTWVFGVRLEPWSAHCWIQQGQFAFNEGVEEAATYTPIMAI
jgi:hypothetical protein